MPLLPQFHFLMQKLPWTGQTEGRQRTDRGQTKTGKKQIEDTQDRQRPDRGQTGDRQDRFETDKTDI